MYVKTDSAALHLEMVEAFGLPVPASEEMAEVFSGYHVGSGPRYWHYDPLKKLWDVKSEAILNSRVAPSSSWDEKERGEIARALADLDLMSPPTFPENTEQKASEPPFIYGSYIFAWVFLPELKRWSLAPLGKFVSTLKLRELESTSPIRA